MMTAEFQAAVCASLSERVWQRHVEALAAALGYRLYHTHDSRRSAAGFPDLVLLKPPRPPIYAELKTERGRVSPAQQEWISDLQEAGCEVYIWRPSQRDEVLRILGLPFVEPGERR